MKDNHVLLVEALLSFMYKCSYDVPQPEALKISEVCFHAAMITIADKYQLINLKGFAGIQLRNAVDKRKFTLQELLTKALAISQSLPDKDLGARHHLAYNISREFALSLRSGAPEQYINSTNALEKAVSADPAFAKQVVNWSLAMISTTMVV